MRVYYNGKFYSSPIYSDRGLLYGDGVYETMKAVEGRIPFLLEHYNRLIESLNASRIKIRLSLSDFKDIIYAALKKNGLINKTAVVRLTVTKGFSKEFGFYSKKFKASIFCHTYKMPEIKKSVKILLVDGFRQLPHIKYTSNFVQVMALYKAKEAGFDEAVFLRDGFILEGTSSNIFIVKNGAIYTSPLSSGILDGITRMKVIECALDLGFKVYERNLKIKDFFMGDECFITSSLRDILPVHYAAYGSKKKHFKSFKIANILMHKFKEKVSCSLTLLK